ncbi:MAG: hypothetical protein Q9169_005109 [Polycauliona sp. 2 TL-2023]
MSPRGGGGSSSGGSGRSGGGSLSSSSGFRGGSSFGSGGTIGISSYSSGSTPPSYSGDSKGIKGSPRPAYSGGSMAGRGARQSWSGNARYSCDDDDGDDDASCAYASAAIPSKNNPFGSLSRRAPVQPRVQPRNVFEATKEPSAASENHLLLQPQSTRCTGITSTAQVTTAYDSWSLCQPPDGSNCKALFCSVASDPAPFFFVFVLLLLLGTICFGASKIQEHQKRSGRYKNYAVTTNEWPVAEMKVLHIEIADTPEAEDIKAGLVADLDLPHCTAGIEERVKDCKET